MGFRTVDFFSPVIYGVFTLFNTLMVIFGLAVRIKDALGGGVVSLFVYQPASRGMKLRG
jgi:hypothetical protein